MNIISEPFVEAANATCVESPAEHDEWEVAGLEKEESVSLLLVLFLSPGPPSGDRVVHWDTKTHFLS